MSPKKNHSPQRRQEPEAERDRLGTILDSVEDGIYIVGRDYRIQFMNLALRSRIGNGEGELCHEFFGHAPSQCEHCQHEIGSFGPGHQRECTFGASTRIYEMAVSPIHGPDGTISRLHILRDITERKILEGRLHEYSRKLEAKVAEQAEKLLRQDLPQAVFGETTRLAFGLDPADQTPTDHPVAGRFFALPEGATLESLGTIEGMPEAPAGLLDAIRAYSGLGPTEVPQAGRLLYLPTPEQVGSGPKPGEVGSMHMKAPEGVDARALLTKLLDVAGSDDTDLDAVAKQTLTNARLLLGVLNSMGPPPVKMPDNTSSTVGLNPLGEPIPVAP